MRETFDDKHLRQFSLTLDIWETLAIFLEIPTSDIANIRSQGDTVVRSLKMLECWKQRRGSMATYEAMIKVLLQISRTDLAEKVIILRRSSSDTTTSPANSNGVDNEATPKVIPTLTELEKEFYKLVIFIEATLKRNNVEIDTITRRFSMLPQSVRRRHRTDKNYTTIRQKILDSDTVKRLFDNLTALKHWNYI
jgi:hypothetical protein